MLARFAADAVLIAHLAFIAFVMAGALLAFRWRAVLAAHVPAVAWAIFVEATGTICPLTYVENAFRAAAGASGYSNDFVEHYLLGAIYPAGLTRDVQFAVAAIVIVVNAVIYLALWRTRRRRRAPRTPDYARSRGTAGSVSHQT
ncbi:MAG TPA: DUF2784 domain-containing protein [Casimicrobiaceae bacterium]|nr:DUF2784 domain-containing protein [Casimicrobiaceae bacterium]